VTRPVAFLSDFGLDDVFVGVCHGVLARGSPSSRVIDLTHAVPPQDVRRGALLLARAVPYVPDDAVYLAVVDPGVGTSRRPLALVTGSGAAMVGPDNGLLSMAWAVLGGVSRAAEVTSADVILRPTSATFHGRDVFAPAAAHLAAGGALSDLGPGVDTLSLATLPPPSADVLPGSLRCQAIGVDRFGNVELSAGEVDLRSAALDGAEAFDAEIPAGNVIMARARTFGDVGPGDAALVVDSSGWLTIVVNGGSAAEGFALSVGDPVVLRAATGPVG
jgi:S-adenosylmethionine hydrolase